MIDRDISHFRKENTFQATTFDPNKRTKTVAVPRGAKVTLCQVEGCGRITSFWMTFPGWFWQHWNPSAPISQTILKTLILRIYWDGSDRPAVQAPVGDFFGNGLCEVSNFASRYLGMSSGGFYCRFPMPFRKGFRVELENLDALVDTDVFANILYQLSDDAGPERGWFHAQFQTSRLRGPEPVPVLEAAGRGHYVGCVFSAQGEEPNYLSFLEAPEYVYLDGAESPSITGTGMEDYFLGGWYFREGTFAGELHGVPSKDSLNASIAMYRVHEQDAIRFDKGIRFCFLNPWSPERLKPYACSSVAFCYLDTPQGTPKELPGRDDLLCWYRIRNIDHVSIP